MSTWIESNRIDRSNKTEASRKHNQILDRPAAKTTVSRLRTTAPATRAGRREMLLPPPGDLDDDGAGENDALAVPKIAAASMSMTIARSLDGPRAQAEDTKGGRRPDGGSSGLVVAEQMTQQQTRWALRLCGQTDFLWRAAFGIL